ncbi:hypothetical protein C4561_01730 [candidate division WWE3 bacterium]|uniref:DNA polymerase III subunit beta n=1 Tax=candidate division WWE3 bacterium TaxID=2053526 RepID=A0A3A4ZEQ0_UNCKA|nr:MAG: hypothetical protein C4561_01730 [candidate division WWE3 bacterium]
MEIVKTRVEIEHADLIDALRAISHISPGAIVKYALFSTKNGSLRIAGNGNTASLDMLYPAVIEGEDFKLSFRNTELLSYIEHLSGRIVLTFDSASVTIRMQGKKSFCKLSAANHPNLLLFDSSINLDTLKLEELHSLPSEAYKKIMSDAAAFCAPESAHVPVEFNTIGISSSGFFSSNRAIACKLETTTLKDIFNRAVSISRAAVDFLPFFPAETISVGYSDRAFYLYNSFEKEGRTYTRFVAIYNMISQFPIEVVNDHFANFKVGFSFNLNLEEIISALRLSCSLANKPDSDVVSIKAVDSRYLLSMTLEDGTYFEDELEVSGSFDKATVINVRSSMLLKIAQFVLDHGRSALTISLDPSKSQLLIDGGEGVKILLARSA